MLPAVLSQEVTCFVYWILWKESGFKWCFLGTKVDYTWTWKRLMIMVYVAEGLSRAKFRMHCFGKAGMEEAVCEEGWNGDRVERGYEALLLPWKEFWRINRDVKGDIYEILIMLFDEIHNPWNLKYNPLDSLLCHGVGSVWRTKYALILASISDREAEALLQITASIASFLILIKSPNTFHKPLESVGALVLRGWLCTFHWLWNSWPGP